MILKKLSKGKNLKSEKWAYRVGLSGDAAAAVGLHERSDGE